jgi:hypothetical protein
VTISCGLGTSSQRGSGDPAGHAAVHGQPGESGDHAGEGITRPDDLEAALTTNLIVKAAKSVASVN